MAPITRNIRRSDPSVLSKMDAERARLQKERQAAEKELQRQMDAEKEKREAEKKLRDDERKREEEAQKQADDAKRTTEEARIAARISPEESTRHCRSNSNGDDSINDLLQSGGADMDLDVDFGYNNDAPSIDDVLRSPPKKNARFSNIVQQLHPSFANPSALKEPNKQTRPAKTSQLKKSALKIPTHKHSHPRTIVESSILLPSDKAENCFIEALRELLRNGKMVDKHFAFAPVKRSNKEELISDANAIPNNMTLLSNHFKISYQGSKNPFEKQKVWGKPKKDKDKEEFKDPTVFFSFAIASEEEPSEILERINQEWFKQGGRYLRVKELQSFDSVTIITLFNISIQVPKKCLLEEYKMILTEAQGKANDMQLDDFIFDPHDLPENSSIPAIELRLQVPKLPGQDTSHFNKLEYRVQNNRRAYHVECDKRFSEAIKRLTQLAKEFHIVTDYWGKHAHLSEVADSSSSPSEVKDLCKVSQKHTNYQITMVVEDLLGITNLDAAASLYNEAGEATKGLTLRHVLLTKFKLKDGFQLIAEVHQSAAPMSPVQVVIPQTPEAEKMILMMNKNFPAFLSFVLRDLHFPEQAIQEYVRRCCCQVKAAEIPDCSWNSETATLTTPQDLRRSSTDDFSSASWYKDAFADLGISRGKSKPTPPPENLFKLDEERSVFTIHKRNEQRPIQLDEDSLATNQDKEMDKTVDLTGNHGPSETIHMMDSDEDSASPSSNDEMPHSTAAAGEDIDESSTSSDEVSGGTVVAAHAE
jgi:hypothetical protein